MPIPNIIVPTRVVEEYQFPAGVAASTALGIIYPDDNSPNIPKEYTAILQAVTGRITFKFGNTIAGTTASATVDATTKKLPSGNFSVVAGQSLVVRLNSGSDKFLSVISDTAASTAIVGIASIIA